MEFASALSRHDRSVRQSIQTVRGYQTSKLDTHGASRHQRFRI